MSAHHPSFLPPYSTDEAPAYTAFASPSEEVLQRRVSTTSSAHAYWTSFGEYEYKARSVVLNLGPRLHGTEIPVYGSKGIISGWIQLPPATLCCVSEIRVTIQGNAAVTLSTSKSPRIVPFLRSETTIYTPDSSLSTAEGGRISFSVSIPENIDDGSAPLPPTFSMYRSSFTAYTRYVFRVDVIRKGWHRNESLVPPILYLPKTATPHPRMPIAPLRPPFRTSIISGVGGLSAEFVFPSPSSFAAQRPIPFTIILYPPTPRNLEPEVTLVKSITVIVANQRRTDEIVLGKARVWLEAGREHDMGVEERLVKGELQGGAPGGESSWAVDGLIEVKYLIRLLFPSCGVEHSEVVTLCTNEWDIEEMDLDLPAVGLASSTGTYFLSRP